MTHLTLDFSACSPLSQGLGIKLTPKSATRSRPRLQPLWDMPNRLHWRTVSPLARRLLNPVPPSQDNRAGVGQKLKGQKPRKPAHKGQAACKECQLKYSQMDTGDALAGKAEVPAALSRWRLLIRSRRQLKWDSYDNSQEGRTTTVAGFIDWGPTGTDSIDEDGKGDTNVTLSTRASTTTVATTTSTTTRLSQRTFTVVTTTESKSTTTSTTSHAETVKPSKPGDKTGKTWKREAVSSWKACSAPHTWDTISLVSQWHSDIGYFDINYRDEMWSSCHFHKIKLDINWVISCHIVITTEISTDATAYKGKYHFSTCLSFTFKSTCEGWNAVL